MGAAVGAVLFAPLSSLYFGLYALTVVTLGVLGTWAAGQAEAFFGRADDGRIVIDEVVGQLVTLAPLLAAPGRELGRGAWWIWVVTGFVLFRVFDIWKPGPARWAERNFKGGAGVVLDDVVAGCFGALVFSAILGLGAG